MIANQIAKDVRTAAEIALAAFVVSIESVIFFGALYIAVV